MSKSDIKTSLENGAHKLLSQLTGEWEGTTKTWFEPNVLADESPMRGTMESILGGRFIKHEYSGSLQGKPFEGIAMYGCNLQTGKFSCIWVDSFHMGTEVMMSEGEKTEKGFSVFGHYGYGVTEGEPWGWRTNLELQGNDALLITAYNISPEGAEEKATETVYKRKS